MDYYCKECEAQVFVSLVGVVLRNCEHHTATIVAERTCTLVGEGGVQPQSLADRAQAALAKIMGAFK